jgi:hypothetical protein
MVLVSRYSGEVGFEYTFVPPGIINIIQCPRAKFRSSECAKIRFSELNILKMDFNEISKCVCTNSKGACERAHFNHVSQKMLKVKMNMKLMMKFGGY